MTTASSRVKYQLAVEQFATPPVNVNEVPISLSTAGNVVVSELGMGASAGAYVSSTDPVSVVTSDVFAHGAQTTPQFMPVVLADSFAIVETLDLTVDHIYFVNVSAGCTASRAGTWACDGHATASFVLDQALTAGVKDARPDRATRAPPAAPQPPRDRGCRGLR